MYIIIISTLLNCFSFSLSSQNLSFSQVFPTIDFWYVHLDRLRRLKPLFWLIMLIGLFYFLIYEVYFANMGSMFLSLFFQFLIPCGRLSWLSISFLTAWEILAYRIVSSVCLSVPLSPETRIGLTSAAALHARHQGCHRCFLLPVKHFTPLVKCMLAAGAYSWHPWTRHTTLTQETVIKRWRRSVSVNDNAVFYLHGVVRSFLWPPDSDSAEIASGTFN